MPAAEQTRALLTRRPDRRPIRITLEAPKLEMLGAQVRASAEAPFSVFIPEHQEQAMELAAELMDLANRESVDAALARAEQAADEVSVELAQYSLMVFITHHPVGRSLPIPPLDERVPEHVRPTSQPRPTTKLESLGATGDEAALDWYREDADANGHHQRWHVVYPSRGTPDPQNPFGRRIVKDRQGELFLYMHQQMLARYDAERLSAGLPIIEPLFDFTAPLPEGYEPQIPGFDSRVPDSLMSDSTEFDPNILAQWDQRLFRDVVKRDGKLRRPDGNEVVATPDAIGNTSESDVASVNPNFYGSLHNMGHVTIAFIPDPDSVEPQQGGVMQSTDVAIRDPIFYRWHRHIDDLLYGWQEEQSEQSFDDVPRVLLRNDLQDDDEADGRSPDLAIVLDSEIAGDPQAFGDQHFGGDNWSTDPADTGVATDELETTLRERQLAGDTVQYLDHPDYHYFLRVENPLDDEQTVTVRLFLAPLEVADRRRFWIELDKFQHRLAPGRSVVTRSSRLSSVVRKPASRPGDPAPAPEAGADPNYCDCGWPYHLLLPRGTAAGMPCRLLAVLTDWALDKVEVEGTCGSMSFCGKRDTAYPDRRPMGYPFGLRWPGGDLAKVIREQPSMAARDIKIRNV